MNSLEDISLIKKLDQKDVLGSSRLILDQALQIHSQIEQQQFQADFSGIKNVVFSGMGGSALGAQVVLSLFKDKLKCPLVINNDYELPEFAGQDTLLILGSYSGSTEETLNSLEEGKKRGCKMIGITTGGKLLELLKSNNIDFVVFDPKNNPCGQPRLGLGYALMGIIDILRKTGILDLESSVINQAMEQAKVRSLEIEREAREMASKVYGNIPVIFAASFLSGTIYAMRNQFNETAKSFSSFHIIPEANHHVMEGLKNPPDRKLIGLSIESDLYPEKILKRVALTKVVLSKNNMDVLEFKAVSREKLAQAFEVLSFGSFLTFYLAILYDQDPSLIPWVDYFKENLASS